MIHLHDQAGTAVCPSSALPPLRTRGTLSADYQHCSGFAPGPSSSLPLPRKRYKMAARWKRLHEMLSAVMRMSTWHFGCLFRKVTRLVHIFQDQKTFLPGKNGVAEGQPGSCRVESRLHRVSFKKEKGRNWNPPWLPVNKSPGGAPVLKWNICRGNLHSSSITHTLSEWKSSFNCQHKKNDPSHVPRREERAERKGREKGPYNKAIAPRADTALSHCPPCEDHFLLPRGLSLRRRKECVCVCVCVCFSSPAAGG